MQSPGFCLPIRHSPEDALDSVDEQEACLRLMVGFRAYG